LAKGLWMLKAFINDCNVYICFNLFYRFKLN
jgi:hypothetical protein